MPYTKLTTTTYWYNAKGELHRDDDGPVIITETDGVVISKLWKFNDEARCATHPSYIDYMGGPTHWYNKNGDFHRLDGPAIIHKSGAELWYKDGKLHRDGGPAIVYPNEISESWYQDGKLHRDGRPAVTYPNGSTEWYQEGQLHRDGGPAVTYPNGSTKWYNKGVRTDRPW